MAELVRINDELVTTDDFVKYLKLSGRYDSLIEEAVKEKVTVHAARKAGVEVTPEDIQERCDQIRRVRGLHRAVDMNRWLDQLGVDLEDLEAFIVEMLHYEKMQELIVTDDAVGDYFSLNSPKFDSISISHIIVDSEGKAREIKAIAEDDAGMFETLASDHSMAETRAKGGRIGKVMRGALAAEVEAKIFHGEVGELLGPFPAADGTSFELFMIDERHDATLDDETAGEIRRLLKEEWIAARAKESRIELC